MLHKFNGNKFKSETHCMPLPEPTCRESYGAWLADMRSALLHKILLMHPPIGIRLPRFRFFNRSFQQLSQTNSCPTHFHLRQELNLFYMVDKKKKKNFL